MRIAAKRLDIFVHPLQSCSNIKDSLIAGSGILLARQVSQEQVSQESQAVIVGHDHHIVFPGEVAAILVPRASRSDDEAAAVVIEHDRPPALIHSGRPNIKHKAIFGREWFIHAEGGPVRLE